MCGIDEEGRGGHEENVAAAYCVLLVMTRGGQWQKRLSGEFELRTHIR